MENAQNINIIEEIAHNAKITAIGVGGGGNNAIQHLSNTNPNKDLVLMIANTDMQHLNKMPMGIKIPLGQRLTSGLGAGMKPDIGEKAAEESFEDLKNAFRGSNLVFIAAGMGGGTGTGAAPVVAKAAKEVGALTFAIVTKPFNWEGKKRQKLAEEGIKKLKEICDSIMIIPNEKVMALINTNTGCGESFKHVDDVLARAVNGMANIILLEGKINVDFADVNTVLSHKGLALMSTGTSTGTNNNLALESIKNAIESPLFDNISIKNAKGILVNFEASDTFPMMQINEAMNYIIEYSNDDTDTIMGLTTHQGWENDKVNVTIIATGFEQEIISSAKDTSLSTSHMTLRNVDANRDLFVNNTNDLDTPTYVRMARD